MSFFLYGERQLSQTLGLPERRLQAQRAHLAQGVDWGTNATRIAYTKKGVAVLLAGLKLAGDLEEICEKSLLPGCAENGAPAPAPTNVMTGRLTHLYRNPRLIGVTLPDQRLVNVTVRSTLKFRRGMEVPVRPSGAGPNRYELTRRLPRFPGRY